ncbi:hypothetical protein MXB_52, partial [Myxobolus squamalis]
VAKTHAGLFQGNLAILRLVLMLVHAQGSVRVKSTQSTSYLLLRLGMPNLMGTSLQKELYFHQQPNLI